MSITTHRLIAASVTLLKCFLLQIFKLHGGQALSTPLLMPKSKYYEKPETCVNLMTHSGFIVSIPHDLR